MGTDHVHNRYMFTILVRDSKQSCANVTMANSKTNNKTFLNMMKSYRFWPAITVSQNKYNPKYTIHEIG